MTSASDFSPLERLRRAVCAAYPDRRDLGGLVIEGNLVQAWKAYSHVLDVDEADLARRLAPLFGLDAAASLADAEPAALARVPFAFCQAHLLLPLRIAGGRLVVATANPDDSDTAERLHFLADMPVNWVLAGPQAIDDALVKAFAREAKREASAAEGQALDIDENAIVKLARTLMADAIRQRASDLHVQPYLGAFVVRIRVDGVLRRMTMLPDAVAVTLIRHVKARAHMDPTNTLVPQDGRLGMTVDDREFDMRVSTLPSVRGERLVIRFLDQSRVHRLSNAGFSLAAIQTLRRAISRPSGMVILTGPTGSGKTSTLYSMLSELNKSGVNIITVENPVEYRIPGISQVEVNDKAGRTFAAALRSILRQDPDIVLIGEIRDRETAEIATQAALTGHLVLSTLHTNDALTAIPRLLDLGVQPSILADSLVAVASQRLCRSLCMHCRIPVADPLSVEEKAFLDVTHNPPAYRRVGCAKCDFTGYRGRLPVVDIIEMNRRLRDAIATGESRLSELDGLREGGLKSLAVSGSLRVISGDTTVREVMETVGPSFWNELAQHYGAYFSAEQLEAIPVNAAEGQGILLISSDAELAGQLESILRDADLRLVRATALDQLHDILKRDEEISFIIGDIPEGTTLDDAVELLRAGRLQVTWARLPSAVLIPKSLETAIDTFKAAGSMAALLTKPVDGAELLQRIRRAQAR